MADEPAVGTAFAASAALGHREIALRLSLVTAVQGREAGRRWLDLARPQAAAAGAEIVLVGRGADARWAAVGKVLIEPADAPVLVPALWARGILRASGEVIVLTSSDCLPAADWVLSVLAAVRDHPEAAAVGGVLEPDPRGNLVGWAAYFLRYSAYMPPMQPGRVREIAADNGVYRRAALDRYRDAWSSGFWEPSLHALLRRDGQAILVDPRIVVEYHHAHSLAAFSRQRFAHGRAFGAGRFGAAPLVTRAWRILAAPAAAAVLAGRVAARVCAKRRHRLQLLASSPFLAWFVACWIAGETVGYLLGPSPLPRTKAGHGC